jgi:hypothetical protein
MKVGFNFVYGNIPMRRRVRAGTLVNNEYLRGLVLHSELFGNLALAIKRGEAVIGFDSGRVRVMPALREIQAAAE